MTVLANPPTALDALFEPRTSAAIANTGFLYGGTDLAQRFETIASGSAAAATGLLVGGADLNTKFCALGTAALPWSAAIATTYFSPNTFWSAKLNKFVQIYLT
jgi:hypothetical protein